MNQQNILLTVLVSAVMAFATGCDNGGDDSAVGGATGMGGSTSTGTGGGGMTSSGEGVLLTADMTGWVDMTSNTLGIQGPWYAYADSTNAKGEPMGDCQNPEKGNHMTSECSVVTTPPQGSFAPDAMGRMCTSGTVAKVIAKVNGTGASDYDYDNIWGAGIALDLNSPGGMDAVAMPFDATAKGVTGFSFDLSTDSGTKVSGLRVEFPTPTTKSGANYWGATSSYPDSPAVVGTNTIHWADVKSPDTTKVAAFEPSQILSIQFHVSASTSMTRPYSFCISNLKALTQ